jgi:hypothetical protein
VKHTLGECDRCARVVRLVSLKPLTINRTRTDLRVCSECWEEDHPQYRAGEHVPLDGEVLRDPRPARSTS